MNEGEDLGKQLRAIRTGPSFRRMTRLGCWLSASIVVVVAILSCLGPYTNFLWYLHDARHPEVISIAYGTRGKLFAMAFIPAWAILYYSVKRALSLSMIYMQTSASFGQAVVTQIVGWVQSRGANAVRFIAPLLAFLSATSFSNEWATMLLAQHAQKFGIVDPIFHMDLGFFVFKLPWYQALANFAFGLLLLTTLVTVGVYVGLQALAAIAKIELNRPQVRVHIGLLLGLTLVALGTQSWLKCYSYGLIDGEQFVGAGYTATRQLQVQFVLTAVLLAAGVACIAGARFGSPYRFAAWGVGGSAIVYFLGIVAFPALLQRVLVEPNKLTLENSYAKRALTMTKFAYGLDKIEDRAVDVQAVPTADDVAVSQTTLSNMRLWDPDVLRQALDAMQGIKTYYTFNDVDVDRYQVDGQERMVMIAPRDTRLAGLDPASQTWLNQRLQYTHGIGVAITQVNTATESGRPTFFARDLPQWSTSDFKIDEPRLYFSDFRNEAGEPDEEYVLVDTKVPEFDYPAGEESKTTRWTGGRGIPVGDFWSRLAFSIELGDGNLLVTPNVASTTRLLRHRNIRDRAALVYPFLKFDRDPYIVVLNGRLIWILDGYTTTDSIPYAARTGDGPAEINYLRNSVKVTIDAYTGEINAYAVQPDEPILEAYREIYPKLIRDAVDMPQGLRAHFRYPEDLLQIQANQLQIYHVTDPVIFLNNGDAWQLPLERGLNGEQNSMPPYYVMMRLPDEPTEGFMQILPFTPNRKPNLSGWMAAHCDPDNYGRVVLYRYPQGSPLNGPELQESTFSQDPVVANINRQFNNDQSEIVVGNLLVVPIGKSVMYVEPLFLKSKTVGLQAVPELTEVLLAVNGKVVVGSTYKEALDGLFGSARETSSPRSTPKSNAPTPPGQTQAALPAAPPPDVRDALDLLDQADAALRAGDFAKYGDLQKKARAKLRSLVSK